jgi:hypothetical protein
MPGNVGGFLQRGALTCSPSLCGKSAVVLQDLLRVQARVIIVAPTRRL